MKIIKISCCADCPYSESKLQDVIKGEHFYIPICKEQKGRISVTTFENSKIWGKCRLEDKK